MEEKTQEIAIVEGLLVPFGDKYNNELIIGVCEPNFNNDRFTKESILYIRVDKNDSKILYPTDENTNYDIYFNIYDNIRLTEEPDDYDIIGVSFKIERKKDGIYLDSMIHNELFIKAFKKDEQFGYNISGYIRKMYESNKIIELDIRCVSIAPDYELTDRRCICKIKEEKDV